MPPIRLGNATAATVVVFSHGTVRPQIVENCGRWFNAVPESLLALEKSSGIHIYFLCSGATDGGIQGSFIFARAREIETTLDKLIAVGVSPRNIFLAGHSAGGWASLMMVKNAGHKFNAVIAFAPSCCGPRSEASIYPAWRGKVRPSQVRKILDVERIEALVFGYDDDRFNSPEDLRFLTEAFPVSVKLVGYYCGNGHTTHLRDCQLTKTTRLIRNYIRDRQAAFKVARPTS
jgi:pimeloyl-ACP methyl ester carboxylesterase